MSSNQYKVNNSSIYIMESVSEKVILITGGAGGIGFAMVKELLLNGAKGIAIVDVAEGAGEKALNELSASYSSKAIFIKTDVTVKTELEGAFKRTVETFKQLDVVINNAGIVNEIQWQKCIDVNFISVVEGTYLAMQKYLPKYKSGKEGVIINTASILGLESCQYSPMYCATKHAVVALGKSLGGDEFYKKYCVRVLTILPGLVKTDMLKPKCDTSRFIFPAATMKEIMTLNRVVQEPESVGQALIEIIRKGKNGSLWVTEDDEPVYEVVVPNRKSMKVSN